MNWGEKLFDLLLGAVPGAAALIPAHVQKAARARLEDVNPLAEGISANKDLLRALRLAWIDAALTLDEHVRAGCEQGEWSGQREDVDRFSSVLRPRLLQQRRAAFNRRLDAGRGPIDEHLAAVLAGLSSHVRGTEGEDHSAALSSAFARTAAGLTGDGVEDVPAPYAELAAGGFASAAGAPRRSFGELVFDALADLLKDPERYPEARQAWSMAIDDVLLDLVKRVLQGVGGVDAKLDRVLGRLDSVEAFGDLTAFAARIDVLVASAERTESMVGAMSPKVDAIHADVRFLRQRAEQEAPAPPPGDPAAAAEPPDSPLYLGLRTYRREHSSHFFGRERDVRDLVALIAEGPQRSLLLKGGSGVGKSSLLFAGVLPRLPGTPRRRPRNSLYFTPGSDPFAELVKAISARRALPTPADQQARLVEQLAQKPSLLAPTLEREIAGTGRRVLYVDQLEELLVVPGGPGADGDDALVRRQAFVEGLQAFIDSDERNFLVASIRSDRSGDLGLDRWRSLARVFARGVERWLHLPEHDADVDAIVRGPCELVGMPVDERLLAAIHADIRGAECWTPLVSLCLLRMVETLELRAADGAPRRMSLDLYHAVGGLHGVVGRLAAEAEDEIASQGWMPLLPELFRRLVRLDPATRDATKDRISASALAGLPQLVPLVTLLRDRWRLLSEESGLQLSHDILMREWGSLSEWISRNRQSLMERTVLPVRAALWAELGQPAAKLAGPEDLLSEKGELIEAARWAGENDEVTRRWIAASARARLRRGLLDELNKAQVSLSVLLEHVRAGARLEPDDSQHLRPDALPFYYALVPQDAPLPAADAPHGGVPADDAAALDPRAQFAGASGDTELQRRLTYFEPGHLALRLGTGAFGIEHFAAIGGGGVALLERLAALGATFDTASAGGNTALKVAAFAGRTDILAWLLDRVRASGADPGPMLARLDDQGRHALHWAACSDDAATVAQVLSAMQLCDAIDAPSDQGWTPLAMAVQRDAAPVVELMLDAGACDVHAQVDGHGLVRLAIVFAAWRALAVLLDRLPTEALHGADEEAPLLTLVRAWRGCADDARAQVVHLAGRLLERGADPDARDAQGLPLLCMAASAGALEIVRLLLARCDGSARDADGQGALHHALQSGHEACALAIVESCEAAGLPAAAASGAGSEAPRHAVWPIEWAVRGAAEPVVARLLERGHWPDAPAARTRLLVSALEGAGRSGRNRLRRGRIFERLLEHGASLPAHLEPVHDEARRVVALAVAQTALEPVPRQPHWWSVPPVIEGSWRVPPAGDAAQMLGDAIAAGQLPLGVLAERRPLAVRERLLPFYERGRLVEVALAGDGGIEATLVLLGTRAGWWRLDGRSEPIHKANAATPVRLSDAPVAREYADMFCALTHGEHGAFRMVRSPADALWRGDAPLDVVDAFEAHCAEPLAPVRAGEGGTFLFDCRLVYSNALFQARMQVGSDGSVEMLDDTTLMSDLPLHREVFVDGLRRVS